MNSFSKLPSTPASESSDALAAMARKVATLSDDRFLEAINLLAPLTGSPEAIDLLDRARDRLRALRPTRPLMLKRQFYMPFEDLLHSEPTEQEGRIPRAVIEPVWAVLTDRDPVAMKQFHGKLMRLSALQPEDVFNLSKDFWHRAAEILNPPWPSAPPSLPLLLNTIRAGVEIEAFKRLVPGGGLASFDPLVISAIVETVHKLEERNVPLDGYLSVVSLRMATPIRLLGTLQEHGVIVPRVLSRHIEGLAVSDLAARAGRFQERVQSLNLDSASVAREAAKLVHTLGQTRELISGSAARVALEKQSPEWLGVICQALKTKVVDGAARVIASGLQPGVDRSSVREAESRACALRASRLAASALGLAPMVEAEAAEIRGKIETTLEATLKVLEKPNTNGTDTADARAQLIRALRMLELIDGSRAASPYVIRLMRSGKKT